MSDDVWVMEPGKGNRILELGAGRADVLRRLAAAGFEVDEDEEEQTENGDCWLFVDEMDAELRFSAGPNSVLQEIAVSDERVRLGPMEIIDQPVGKIIDLLKVANEETLWTLPAYELAIAKNQEATGTSAQSAAASTSAEPLTDERLLKGSTTLWVRPFGLGFVVIYGDVLTINLRRPGDIPLEGLGPLTPAQRELANREDLNSHLFGSTHPASTPLPGIGRFQQLVGLGLVIGLGFVIWRAIDYQRQWNAAPAVQASVVAVQPPPPEPFPVEYTVEYFDNDGVRHEVELQRNDVYATLRLGDTVELRYLPEAPDEPLGPVRVTDVAVEKYLPWGIGIVAAFLILRFAAAIAGLVLRSATTAAVEPADAEEAT